MSPVLAGRNADGVALLAEELRLEFRVFGLGKDRLIDEGLSDVPIVLNCAGPFVKTAAPLARACLRAGIHYLDIGGEVPALEQLVALHQEALDRSVMLLPAVGFDVVPTDCVAAHVKRRLPSAIRLAVGYQVRGRLSRGTLRTMLEQLPRGGVVRRDGALKAVPLGWKARRFLIEDRRIDATTFPLADVTTAYHSTGIPNVDAYIGLPSALIWAFKASGPFSGALALGPIKAAAEACLDSLAHRGPSPDQREKGESLVWAEASDPGGRRVLSKLELGEGYSVTVKTALRAIERVRRADLTPGFQTPAKAYSPDFILECDDCRRTDIY
jgi:short subunit dehydrogenase-like uncharacterized protein